VEQALLEELRESEEMMEVYRAQGGIRALRAFTGRIEAIVNMAMEEEERHE